MYIVILAYNHVKLAIVVILSKSTGQPWLVASRWEKTKFMFHFISSWLPRVDWREGGREVKPNVSYCKNISTGENGVSQTRCHTVCQHCQLCHDCKWQYVLYFVKDTKDSTSVCERQYLPIKCKYLLRLIFFFFFPVFHKLLYLLGVTKHCTVLHKKMFLTQVISPVQIGRTHFTPAAKEARWPKTISCYSRFGKHVSTWPISLKLMVSTINMVQSSWYINSRSHLRAVVQRHPVWYYHSHHH